MLKAIRFMVGPSMPAYKHTPTQARGIDVGQLGIENTPTLGVTGVSSECQGAELVSRSQASSRGF
jgi:hypothetical protein